ncbi:cation diffusion facilitator family transporter [Bacillus taeanensis]|uniref:Transporter n=1 Tax=Bacillus taeanensis TaxID=273032 RepID=A0A366XUV8_9BACI|nr:cation diffusion facilitator family transporter [Bacillus taeanensis]RBW68925.1 transporter [Bacillus taeanensis]
MVGEEYQNLKKGETGAWISIAAYLLLASLKLFIGIIGQSKSLQADGLNNVTDIIASLAVLIGLKIARKPPDHNHRYGHFRAETIASLIAAFIMMSVGIQVLFEGLLSLYNGKTDSPDIITAWTALFSALAMYGVYRYNNQLAKKINSSSLMAAAQDNRSDALVSIGAFIGITGSQFGLPWLDPIAAVLVGIIICKTAWEIFHDSSYTLTDGFDEEQLANIKKTIGATPGVIALTDIKARTHGNQSFVDATITVNPELNVVESHRITEQIEERMLTKHGIQHVHIHIEPT